MGRILNILLAALALWCVGCCPDCPPGMDCPLCPAYKRGAEMQSRISRLAADSARCVEWIDNFPCTLKVGQVYKLPFYTQSQEGR